MSERKSLYSRYTCFRKCGGFRWSRQRKTSLYWLRSSKDCSNSASNALPTIKSLGRREFRNCWRPTMQHHRSLGRGSLLNTSSSTRSVFTSSQPRWLRWWQRSEMESRRCWLWASSNADHSALGIWFLHGNLRYQKYSHHFMGPFHIVKVPRRYSYQLMDGQKWNVWLLKHYLIPTTNWAKFLPVVQMPEAVNHARMNGTLTKTVQSLSR